MRVFQAEKVPRPRGWESWRWPLDGEVDLEIGCGVGWHPIRYAQANTDRHLIAIEHTRNKFESFARRIERHRAKDEQALQNLIPVHADAVEWVTHFVPAKSVSRIFILYPNPWPKKSDHHRRWPSLPFMQKLVEVLKPGGLLLLATNIENYAEQARQEWSRFSELRALNSGEIQVGKPGADGLLAPRTHFEKKYLERGERCYEVLYERHP